MHRHRPGATPVGHSPNTPNTGRSPGLYTNPLHPQIASASRTRPDDGDRPQKIYRTRTRSPQR